RAWGSHGRWLSGAPGRALERDEGSLELAASHGPHTLALVHAYGAILRHFRGETEAMLQQAHAAVDLCQRYSFAYYGEWGEMLLAWQDRSVSGADIVARIERARASLRSIGAVSRRSC